MTNSARKRKRNERHLVKDEVMFQVRKEQEQIERERVKPHDLELVLNIIKRKQARFKC